MPHEIAHGLQFSLNKQKADEYDNEFEANQIAMAYWKKIGREKELEKCYKVAKEALLKLKTLFLMVKMKINISRSIIWILCKILTNMATSNLNK